MDQERSSVQQVVGDLQDGCRTKYRHGTGMYTDGSTHMSGSRQANTGC